MDLGLRILLHVCFSRTEFGLCDIYFDLFLQVPGVVGWRREGLHYKKNEVRIFYCIFICYDLFDGQLWWILSFLVAGVSGYCGKCKSSYVFKRYWCFVLHTCVSNIGVSRYYLFYLCTYLTHMLYNLLTFASNIYWMQIQWPKW